MKITVKKLTLMAILAALALIIFIIEAQVPLPVPVPGVKLGLANAVTLFALFYSAGGLKHIPAAKDSSQAPNGNEGMGDTGFRDEHGMTDKVGEDSSRTHNEKKTGSSSLSYLTTSNVFGILLCRILLGAVFTGRLVAFAYSLTGGLLAFAAQVAVKRFVSQKQIWVCGAVGAVLHNVGQILAAMLITGTPAIVAYLPILIIAGVITGSLTGFVAQLAVERLGLPQSA